MRKGLGFVIVFWGEMGLWGGGKGGGVVVVGDGKKCIDLLSPHVVVFLSAVDLDFYKYTETYAVNMCAFGNLDEINFITILICNINQVMGFVCEEE